MESSSSEKLRSSSSSSSSSDEEWEKDLNWLIDNSEATDKKSNAKETNDEENVEKKKDETTKDDEVRTETTTDTEDDEDGLTSESRPIVQRNTKLNDAQDGEDYDVQARLQKANEDLANDSASAAEERERKVLFKTNLVDLEAPPDDYSSSSSSEDEEDIKETSKNMTEVRVSDEEAEDTVDFNGQKVRKDEKVLIERGGKFELVEASELKSMLPPVQSGDSGHPIAVINDDQTVRHAQRSTLPPVKPRPKSAPVRAPKPRPPSSARPVSASETPQFRRKNERPFSYSPEMKKLLKKQADAKAAKQLEDERRKKAEEEAAREEAEDAWKAWVERKAVATKEKRKQNREEAKKRQELDRKDPEEADVAYSEWLKHKSKQIKHERLLTQQQQIERDEGWFMRERKECNRAFRQWLRGKNEAARKQRELEKTLRRQSRREARQVRRAQKLLDSIREAQQMKYVEYYGYRF